MMKSLAARLGGAFVLVVGLFVLVAAGGLWAMQRARDVNDRMIEAVLPAVAAIHGAETAHLAIGVLVRDIVSNPDLSAQAQARKALEVERARLAAAGEALRALAGDARAGVSRAEVDELAARQVRAEAILKRAFDLVERAQYDEGAAVVYDELRPLQAAVTEQVRKMKEGVVAQGKRAATDAATGAGRSLALMTLGTACAIVFALIAAIWITRRLTRALAQAVEVSERIAAGDLAGAIASHSDDEVGRLLAALERMRGQLASSVSVIRGAAESVNVASREIATGNTELSARTEEQSSSLEESSSAMQQLESTVKLNADTAREASRLAQGASATAARGGQTMDQVVVTMAGIDASSRRVTDIIGVIDAIAFQTNILALNAAVEAARAGEQGRGFAVVASEVRSLAHRSADAAKEIKALIGGSSERVKDGSGLVAEAGRTMAEIVASVKEVSDLMGRIAAASQEQLTGIRQVTASVGQMEEATQQNAALVEESAASAEKMAAQATELVAAVSIFRVAGAEAASPARAATPQHAAPLAAPVISRRVAVRAPVATNAAEGEGDWREF